MLPALQSYLTAQGYSNVCCDLMPDTKETIQAINITKWDHTVGSINDGTGTHYIQVQCRDDTYQKAYKTCKNIFELLDSGADETLINLTEDTFCIARPHRGPVIYERGENYITMYCEIALWGKN